MPAVFPAREAFATPLKTLWGYGPRFTAGTPDGMPKSCPWSFSQNPVGFEKSFGKSGENPAFSP
jgi:hypothetical protein